MILNFGSNFYLIFVSAVMFLISRSCSSTLIHFSQIHCLFNECRNVFIVLILTVHFPIIFFLCNVFISKNLIVVGLMCNYSNLFVLIFVYIVKCFQIPYLICRYIIFLISLVEEVIFSQLCIFQTFVEEWLTDLFLGLCFNPLVYMYVFMAVPYCIKYCSFATHILN